MMHPKISGLIAATFTPYDSFGELNLSAIPPLVERLRFGGVKGVFIAGTTGESASLLLTEKLRLLEAYAAFQQDSFKVMMMLSGTNQREAIVLANAARKQGIYGTAVTAPYYFRPSNVGQLIDYMLPIAEAAGELPLYFYHIPLLTRVELPMLELLEQVGDRIPNFAGIKYTHNDLMEFNRCLRFDGSRYDVLWGWDELFLAGLSMGAKGAVGSTYNFAAPLYLRIQEAYERGDMEAALRLQQKSIDFIALYGKYGGPATGKAILGLCGFDFGPFRAPVVPLSKERILALEKELTQLGFFEEIM
ncbi:MAG: dihydrodipicolinate synthase family protein [Lunatimonas sp.]|uniref:dihydrodipicolinate synthase family protein n=1 Tax=Lunatimonas sp. TaxID=2060141 RepID=UPI00263BAEC0|nr:dihydrodipicolinate synthase family protein [Lunatimonas sp.]MCC5936182.1 dihydrodipicolinate synthase family protein [Lunatimonas sp.]